MMMSLGQRESVITFDLTINVKAKESNGADLKSFLIWLSVLRGFHVATSYLSLLGKMYIGSRIEDLLTESGVYGSGTASHPLTGKSHNRGIRGQKLLMKLCFD